MRLPPSVASPLLAARQVEAAARGVQRDAARLATGRLMAAAQAVGLTLSAVSYRIRAARRRGGGGGLSVPARVPDSSGPRVDELDWLTAAQARDLLCVHRHHAAPLAAGRAAAELAAGGNDVSVLPR